MVQSELDGLVAYVVLQLVAQGYVSRPSRLLSPATDRGPKGDKGAPGDRGFKGEPGVHGEPGIQGDRGATGEPGLPGIKGDKGEPGLPGIKGDKGEPGLPGIKGDKGEPGVAGVKGDKGEPGLPGIKGDRGDPGPLLPDVFVVTPGGVLPLYSSIQAAINAAVGGGERTVADPAVVLVLPGSYTESVSLKKHVSVIGMDRLGDYETIVRGGVTCGLTLEGGVREKTSTVLRGLSIFCAPGTPGIRFTGSSSQKLLLHDIAVEGSEVCLLADNTFTAGTGTSQVLAHRCRFRSTAPTKEAVVVRSGAVEAWDSDIWNRDLTAGASNRVVDVGPLAASAKPATLTITNGTIEGIHRVDGSASTSVIAGSVSLNLYKCAISASTPGAAPQPLVTTKGNLAAGVTAIGLVQCVFTASSWVAGKPIVLGAGGVNSLASGGNLFLALGGSSAAVPSLGISLTLPFTSV